MLLRLKAPGLATGALPQSNMSVTRDPQPREPKPPGGLEIEETKTGSGVAAHRGDLVTVRYSGYLNRGDAFQTDVTTTFRLGERRVVAGLERGVEGMKVGGVRKLRVSQHLAYRDTGVAGIVPPNAILVFDVELLSIAAAA